MLQSTQDVKLFMRSMLVTAATILGVGVLALPVKLNACGLLPFLSTFFIALLCQSITICFVVELLQRTEEQMMRRILRAEDPEMVPLGSSPGRGEPRPRRVMSCGTRISRDGLVLNATDAEEAADLEVDSYNPGMNTHGVQPNLHCMALYFIPHRVGRGVFDFCVFIHFIIVLVAYAISASNALNRLTGMSKSGIMSVFMASLSCLIVACDRVLTDAIAAFTVVKGTLLVSVIGISCYVAFNVHRSFTDDWATTCPRSAM
eukprot:TRINITY_DN25155_c0_g1_i1.p2 TRINITY_DN25155_c0_g1~~TRINITY_DN25155_c0_g1_i1.p2  ORF type:complete len:260 (+),score=96.99 TRINITY_DN25155_c0_g1_i1:108-887(+)